jgi:C4-dicarboxylate-binding protein DctP
MRFFLPLNEWLAGKDESLSDPLIVASGEVAHGSMGGKPMKFTKLVSLIAAASVAASASYAEGTTGCDDGEVVVKFSHVTNTDRHPKGIAATLLMERINAEMNGSMCMEVFPSSSLYNDDQVLEAMLQGDVQMAAPSLSKFEAFTKQFRIFDLPFMFTNIDAVDAFQLSETGQAMKDSMQRRGLQGLEFWHNGMKQFSANVPLVSPSDADGLKFRVQTSDVLVAQMEALGASPQPMAFSEVYGALQTGVVDGQENTWSNIYGQKFFEVQDGSTETNHGVLDYLVVTSTDFLDSLDADVRDQFLTILDEVTVERNAAVGEVDADARQAVLDAGGTIVELTDEQRAAWIEAMKPVWERFTDDVGQENIDAAQAINASL